MLRDPSRHFRNRCRLPEVVNGRTAGLPRIVKSLARLQPLMFRTTIGHHHAADGQQAADPGQGLRDLMQPEQSDERGDQRDQE